MKCHLVFFSLAVTSMKHIEKDIKHPQYTWLLVQFFSSLWLLANL